MEKTPRTATLGITEEFRKMNVGDIVHFPTSRYNYNSIRSTPSSSLVNDRINGKSWRVRIDFENKCVIVTRIS